MILKQFLIALSVTAAVWLCFYLATRKRNRGMGYWQPFLIILAGTWAVGVWFTPMGPNFSGLTILPYLAAGIAFGIVFTFIAGRRPPSGRRETLEKLESMSRQKDLEKAAFLTLNIIMWLLLLLLIVAIITRYANLV